MLHSSRIFGKSTQENGNCQFLFWIFWAPMALGVCETSFGVTACYGVKITFTPAISPDSVVKINSPRTTINLSKCPSTETLTIIFEKDCAISISVSHPTLTLPPECVFAVSPEEYRISVSCICLGVILEFFSKFHVRASPHRPAPFFVLKIL